MDLFSGTSDRKRVLKLPRMNTELCSVELLGERLPDESVLYCRCGHSTSRHMQLPDDREELLKLTRTLLAERDREEQQVEQLQVEQPRLQQELEPIQEVVLRATLGSLRSTGASTVASKLRRAAGE
jgi:hypothetical protein